MILIDKEEIIMGDYNTAKVLNTFFSNIVRNLNILRTDLLLTISAILFYSNHPSILAIEELCNKHPRLPFSFSKINREEILREILKLETSKACQDTDIPTKIIKENADILLANFNDSVEKSYFPPSLKR